MFLYTNIQYQFHSIYCFIEKQMKFILADWVNFSQMLHFMEKHEAPSSAAVFVLSIRHFFVRFDINLRFLLLNICRNPFIFISIWNILFFLSSLSKTKRISQVTQSFWQNLPTFKWIFSHKLIMADYHHELWAILTYKETTDSQPGKIAQPS